MVSCAAGLGFSTVLSKHHFMHALDYVYPCNGNKNHWTLNQIVNQSPKVFLPNFLRSLFTKLFIANVFTVWYAGTKKNYLMPLCPWTLFHGKHFLSDFYGQ